MVIQVKERACQPRQRTRKKARRLKKRKEWRWHGIWKHKGQTSRAQGLRKHGGGGERGPSGAKRLTLVGHRGAALGDHPGQREKRWRRGQPQSPISREGSSQRCHNLSLEPQEERREVMRRKRAEQTMMKKHNHSNTVSGNGKPPNVWKLDSTIVFVFYCFVKNYPKV